MMKKYILLLISAMCLFSACQEELIGVSSVAVDKGSRALGKQLGKTRGMFKAFKDEYQKASGGSSKASK